MKTTMMMAVGVAAAVLAGAATAAEPTRVAIPYDGSELASRMQADALLYRLETAALQACGADRESLADYRHAVQGSACYRAKLDDAVAQIDSPRLSRAYGAAGGAGAGR
jgi:UrcA family protein